MSSVVQLSCPQCGNVYELHEFAETTESGEIVCACGEHKWNVGKYKSKRILVLIDLGGCILKGYMTAGDEDKFTFTSVSALARTTRRVNITEKVKDVPIAKKPFINLDELAKLDSQRQDQAIRDALREARGE